MRLLPNGFVRNSAADMAAEWTLSKAFGAVAEQFGYDPTVVSSLYLINESFFGSENRYKLIDREGDCLCLIEDPVTGLLNAAERGINRLYTFAEVYKYRGEERNARRCAALLTGVAGLEAESEMVLLGLDVLKKLGVAGGKVVIGSTYVLQGLAEVYFGYRPDVATIRAWLDSRPKSDAEGAMFAVIEDVRKMRGGVEIIRQASEKLTNKVSGIGLSNVLDFYDVLCGCGLEKQVEIDLSVLGRNYDCGSIFEIRDGNGKVILQGGRHDFNDGADVVRAVSLCMTPSDLLSTYRVVGLEKNVVIGVGDGIIALNAAYSLRETFVSSGVRAVLLYRADPETTRAYANAYDIESAVFVDADGKLHAEK